MRRRAFLTLALLLSSAVAWGQTPTVYRISVSGTVGNGLAPYVARSLREARASGAAAAYLDIDTPGGRIDAAERIADAVRESPVAVYAFVNPRAFSAGALIALSSNGIYMRPGAVLGAATPVTRDGARASGKVGSALRAEFRSLEAGYAKAAVSGEADLLRAIDLPNARVIAIEPSWAEQVVRFITNPLVSPLLLSIGVLGLLFEVKAGAFGLGGLLSLISLGLFFGSSFALGLAGWEEVLLLGLGLLALAVEVFVIPGFGAAGILGAVALAAAVVLAMIGGSPTAGDVMQAFAVLGASLAITAAVAYAWLRHLPSSGRFAGLFLHGGAAQSDGYISAARRADLVGLDGVALTDLRPAGAAQFGVERIDVVTEGEYVAQGTPVRVVRSEGYRHVVRGLA